MIFQDSVIEAFIAMLFQSIILLVLILGALWIIFTFYDTRRRKSFKKVKVESINFEILKFSEILGYLGTSCGLILYVMCDIYFLVNFVPLIIDTQKIISNIILSILGMSLGIIIILKPFYDDSKISIFGVLIALTSTIITTIVFPDTFISLGNVTINPKEILFFILLLFFVVILTLIAFFTEKVILISSILSWPPIDLIISVLCFTVGFILIFGN